MPKLPTAAHLFYTNHLKAAFVLMAVLMMASVDAQKKTPIKKPLVRCGTMEAIANDMKNDPALRERLRQGQLDYEQSLHKKPATGTNLASPLALPGPVEIPVVVHIVLANPWIISDEAVQYFFDRINEDYAGTNADSTNGAAFYNVRGHSLLRFTLAKRDINGNFTTGIIRVVGTTEIIQSNPQPIKNSNTATGGSTGWDVTQYYNMYVGDGGAAGLLGIAPTIGPGTAAGTTFADGVCVDYRSFANLCFSYPEYRLSRTAVHEIGHNFGLYHPFDNGCTTNDFAQLLSAGCLLPPSLLAPADDVPNQSNPTSGCPSPGAASGCSAAPRMFQNYMDYTDDACYSMFTIGEVKRMEWVLENCRPGYLTTLGGQYPDNMPALDAAVNSIVSPGGFDINTATCKSVSYPVLTCPGEFIPRLRITNAGTSRLTSITVTTSVNGINPVTQVIAINIETGKSAVVQLAAQVAVTGDNALTFTLSNPNNGADGNAANNTLTINFSVAAALVLPYTESFQSPIFPPANGSDIVNPDAPEIGWARTATAGRPGSASMWMNFFDYAPDADDNLGQRDIYKLPAINTFAYDSIELAFNVAYQPYPGSNDSLNIIYSKDCGITWSRTAYSKGGTVLATVPGSSTDAFQPANARQWRTEKLMLKDFCESDIKSLVIGFEAVNDFGNNLYVDSVTVRGFNSITADASLDRIAQPVAAICTPGFTPAVTITNRGTDSLKSVNIIYRVDNGPEVLYAWTGSLAKCGTASLALAPATTTVGSHIITVYSSLPNGGADLSNGNDTLRQAFAVFSTTPVSTPVTEGFEQSQFPLNNWGVSNVNGGTTWESTSRSAKSGSRSLVINNGNAANSNGAVDYFISPLIGNSATFDSLFVDFDLAYRSGPQYPGSTVFPLDTLEVLATTDCGATFISVWKKFGFELQTVNDPNYTYTAPFVPRRQDEWRSNRVNLLPFLNGANFQLYFTSKGNKQNNIWLDNISITSQRLPQRLKDQGYLVYPNPFNNTFLIHHSAVEPPVDLQSVQVFNAAGQLVWDKRYNGNAARQITVDLKQLAGGVYILKMTYSNKTVLEKLIKH